MSSCTWPLCYILGLCIKFHLQADMLLRFYFLRRSFAFCRSGWSAVVQSQLTATSASWVQSSPVSASPEAGIIDSCYPTWLIFMFLVETGFYYVGQAGLEVLTSGGLPTWPLKVVGIQA